MDKNKAFELFTMYLRDFMSIHDAAGNYVFASPNSVKFFGWTPKELIGRNAYEFFHPDDLSSIQASHIAQSDPDSKPCPVQYRLKAKDGNWICVETLAGGQVTEGGLDYIVSVTRDISDLAGLRREASAELEVLEEAKTSSSLEDAVLKLKASTDALRGIISRLPPEEAPDA